MNIGLGEFGFEFRITVMVGERGRESNDEQPPFQTFIVRIGKSGEVVAAENELMCGLLDGGSFMVK